MQKRMTTYNYAYISKFLCIVCILFSIVSLFIAKLSPAVGYEPSIYTSTPILVWVSIVFSITSGIALIIGSMFNKNLNQSNLWLVGLYLIFLNYIICISLSIIRGYYLWCIAGDASTHIGFINHILLTGHVSHSLFYPVTHIYTSQIHLLSNTDILTLTKILPLIFGILYLPFMYLLSKYLFSQRNLIILLLVCSSTLVNGWYLNFTPNSIANHYFPLLLYILFKVYSTRNIKWELIVLIIVFLYPIFHIVPTLVFILAATTLCVPRYILNRTNNIKMTLNEKKPFFGLKLTLLILLLVWSITWISSFYVWDYAIKNVYTIIAEDGPNKISGLVENINYANEYGYNVVEHILRTTGGPFVYILISIASFPIIWKNKDEEILNKLFSLYGPFLFISLFILISYFSNFLFDPLRLIVYLVIISSFFIAYLLNYLITAIKTTHKRIFTFSFIGLIFLLFVVWINGIMTLYPSSYTLQPNLQTTHSEVDGINWMFENKNLDLKITGITVSPSRFGQFLLTPEQDKLQQITSIQPYLSLPYHFGYNNNSLLGSHYNQSLYLAITEKDKLMYKDVFPEIANIRWTSNDFEKLNKDKSLNKIYTNEQFEVFYICSLGKM